MSRFTFCNCPAGFSADPERHAPDCPGRSGAGKPAAFVVKPTVKPTVSPPPAAPSGRRVAWFHAGEVDGGAKCVFAADFDRAVAECDEWMSLVGAVCETLPLSEILAGTATGKTLVEYFKALHAERDALQARVDKLTAALTEIAQTAIAGNHGKLQAIGMRATAAIALETDANPRWKS